METTENLNTKTRIETLLDQKKTLEELIKIEETKKLKQIERLLKKYGLFGLGLKELEEVFKKIKS